MSEEVLDVAVVGGGVSGVYSAWRLLTQDPKSRIAVLEASGHIGGRLLSVTPPGLPGVKAELGGMRILPSVQPLITKLIDVLNQKSGPEDQIVTYPFPVDQPDNISYLRGTYLRLKDFTTQPAKVPYRLNFLEFGQTPGSIILNAIDQIVPGITNPNLSEEQRRRMARATELGGKPLWQQGFWGVLARVISGEAYQLGVAAGGYQSTLSNWNAADAIPWYLSDFGVDPDYKGFTKGFQQVPLTVADRFTAAGGEIRFRSAISGFEWKDGIFTLSLKKGGTVQARKLILAMPRRALELVAGGSPILQEDSVAELIKSVTPRPLFKLFTTYTYPWWLPAGVQAGRTTTDLPVRQTYYWPNADGTPVTGGPAMLMASYDDGDNIGFWDGFRPRRGRGWRKEAEDMPEPEWFVGPGDAQAAGVAGSDRWHKYHAPKAMVEEVQRQLTLVHGLSFTPVVQSASFKDWGDDPFGGGWNSWNIGVKSWEVKRAIVQPAGDKVPLYICGEAYSDAQGWVEGALQTAERMLAKLGVPSLADEDS
jgi:monoamine oxidase